MTIEPGISCVADHGLMRIALQNLLANAWKYTTRIEDARIEMTTAAIDGRAVLRVRDNGAGFDMKQAHRLFAPFQRLHSEAEFTGTGLGLASVHRILERHGCRVWADSTAGQGATFFVELPSLGEGEPGTGTAHAPRSEAYSTASASRYSFVTRQRPSLAG